MIPVEGGTRLNEAFKKRAETRRADAGRAARDGSGEANLATG